MTRRYRFDDFEIDLDSFRLSRAGEPILVEPKALNLLIFLVENRGRLVTRNELIHSVWNGAFVTDHVLNRAIGQLRKALADDPKAPRYIETVPTLGYRFVATVSPQSAEARVIEPQATAGIAAEASLTPLQVSADLKPHRDSFLQTEIVSTERPKFWKSRFSSGIALCAILFAATAWGVARWLVHARSAQVRSLVVLPLDNLSGNPDLQALSDGMTDELITSLGQVGALRVISHTTSNQYRNTKKSLPQIASELQVNAVIEGSVLRSGDRIKITARLISASSEKQIWAGTYDGDMHDVLSIQNQVATAIAEQVRIKLSPTEQARLADTHTVNPQAYEAFLKGNYFFRLNTEDAAKKALQYFQQSLQVDPNFARAYVGVARTYNFLGEGPVSAGEATAAADAALARALQLDPDLAEAYAEKAWTLLFYHWDFPGAERDFRHALELQPGLADAHEGYANSLAVVGRFDDAVRQMSMARDLDPLSPLTLTDYCSLLFMARRFVQAEAQCSAALELDPNYSWASGTIGDVYEFQGKYTAAHSAYNKAFKCDQACSDGLDEEFGRPGKAGSFDAWMRAEPDSDPNNAFFLAQIYAGVGHKDKAFDLLEQAYRGRIGMHGLAFLSVDPRFDNLRSDPRFDAFLRRAGLPSQPPRLLSQPRLSSR